MWSIWSFLFSRINWPFIRSFLRATLTIFSFPWSSTLYPCYRWLQVISAFVRSFILNMKMWKLIWCWWRLLHVKWLCLYLRKRFQLILFSLLSPIFRACPIIIVAVIYYLWKMSDLLRTFYHLYILFMCSSIKLFIHKKFRIILSLVFDINISTSLRPFLNAKIFRWKNSIYGHYFLPSFGRVVIVCSD
jgi:hypothetical protein